MKRWISLLILYSQLMFTFHAQGDTRLAAGDVLLDIENRVNGYLQSVLAPDEYMIFVNPKAGGPRFATPSESVDDSTVLPGAPGLSAPPAGKKSQHVDLQNNVIGEDPNRPAVTLNLVLADSVPQTTQQLLRRIVPQVARIDKAHGDAFKMTIGPLKRKNANSDRNPTWVDSIMKYRDDVRALVFSLFALVALYWVMNMLNGIVQKRVGLNSPSPAPHPFESAHKEAVAGSEAPSTSPKKPTRDELYSKDSDFIVLTQDLIEFALRHPERISYLLTSWIQVGKYGIRNAAVLMHNFDFKTSEKILENMVPSDIDYIKTEYDASFDKFSDENVKVVYLARIDLMKVTSQFTKMDQQSRDFDFLKTVEDDVVIEVLKSMPADVVAFASAFIPAHRLSHFVADWGSEFESDYIRELCHLQKVDRDQAEKYKRMLTKRYQEVSSHGFTTTGKVNTLARVLKNVVSYEKQKRILAVIEEQSSELAQKVRAQVVLFEDFNVLSDKVLQTIVVEEDPQVVAQAFANSPIEMQEKVQMLLGSAAAEIFASTISARQFIRPADVDNAQRRLTYRLESMIEDRLLDMNDIKSASQNQSAAKPFSDAA